jgi:hypothetical protein
MQEATGGGKTRHELYAKARQLEVDAIRSAEDGPKDEALIAEAAELRRQALGERIYPVLICSRCSRLTGWLDGAGLCDDCVRRARREAEYSDPRAGWVSVADLRVAVARPARLPVGARLAALVGFRRSLERATAKAWLSLVEPDDTGPVGPEAGYDLEVAHRDQVEAADGSTMLVRFSTATHRFLDGSWVQLATTRISRPDLLTPPEFSAGLPVEQLAEAWGDYGAEVAAFNRDVWSRESQRREDERQSHIARTDMLRDQSGTAELLDEGGARER